MQRLSFGAALAALGVIIILATAIPAAAGTAEVAPLFSGDGFLRSAPAAPCNGAKALNPQTLPEQRTWWPDLCGACSSAPSCVGLLVLDPRPCQTEDGGRGICRSDGWESCADTDPDDNRDEVSCYCSDW